MSYRMVKLGHPDSEGFWVRVSDQAVAEWLAVREQSRLEGNPDRPPDVDTPTARAWVRHPGETHAYFDRPSDAYFPVLTLVWETGPTRLYVTGFRDGAFAVDTHLADGGTRHEFYGAEMDPNVVGEAIDLAIALIGARLPEVPLGNWPWDFDELERLIAEAEADLYAWEHGSVVH